MMPGFPIITVKTRNVLSACSIRSRTAMLTRLGSRPPSARF